MGSKNVSPAARLSSILSLIKNFASLFSVLLAVTTLAVAQTQPNLENGFKHYGSYDFHGIDTVNTMNGNWMVHAPLLPGAAQRGGLHPQTVLYVSSKGWQVKCIPNSGGGQTCFWASGGTSVAFENSYGLRIHRTVDQFGSGTGTVTYQAYGYTILSADGGTHQLYGIPGTADPNGEATKFESLDTSGYHLELSNFDSNSIASTATVMDRQGNQYVATFNNYSGCSKPQTNKLSSPDGHQPAIDDSPLGDRYCSQTAWAKQATDSNGNQISFSVPLGNATAMDTLGRAWPLSTGANTTDYSGCISNYPISGAGFDNYTAPDGSTRSMKVCYAQIPRQTFFNQPGIIEYQNYATPQPMIAMTK